jgi:spore coat polysaccharide biosynthesis protein SpsF
MKEAIIIQARQGSHRLPGKTLAEVVGQPLLAWQVSRLKKVAPVIVATTWDPADTAVGHVASSAGASVVRGPVNDVVHRVWLAAFYHDVQAIAFLGADQPLMDPDTIRQVLDAVHDGAVYARTTGQPYGLHAWAVTRWALDMANRHATTTEEREHTGAFWDRRPKEYPVRVLSTVPDESHHRLTIDHAADLALHRRIMARLSKRWPDVTTQDVLDLLHANPEWEFDTGQITQWKWSGFEEAVR